jgi:hypothetical protein
MMTSTYIAGGISLFLLQIFISVEAFDVHPLGLRSLKSPLNVNKLKAKLVKLEGRRPRFHDEDDVYSSSRISSSTTPHTTCKTDMKKKSTSTSSTNSNEPWSRNQFLLNCRTYMTYGLVASTAASWSSFPDAANAKLYSENAANMERLNNGDFSGGAVFNNNPTTERGAKRRAMTGCKLTMSREEASTTILKRNTMLSEKECNTMVMDGETEFMLQALRNLDCPTCANGIGEVN